MGIIFNKGAVEGCYLVHPVVMKCDKLSGSEKLVLCYMMNCAVTQGSIHFNLGIEKIMKMTSLSKRTVLYAIKTLLDIGLFTKVPSLNGRGNTNKYQINALAINRFLGCNLITDEPKPKKEKKTPKQKPKKEADKNGSIKRFPPPGFIPKEGWLYDMAEEKRNNQTDAEKACAKFLDSIGLEYYSQLPVMVGNDKYIIDFAFRDNEIGKWFACEIDGGYHDEEEQKDKDEKRDANLLRAGWIPIRIKNHDAYSGTRFTNLMFANHAIEILAKIINKPD